MISELTKRGTVVRRAGDHHVALARDLVASAVRRRAATAMYSGVWRERVVKRLQ